MENRPPRISTKEIRNEALKFFNLEKGLVFTFISLIKKPLKTVQVYFNINRRTFSNPLQYLLVGAALYTVALRLHPSFLSFMGFMENLNSNSLKGLKVEKAQSVLQVLERNNQFLELFLSYQNVFYLIVLPVMSFLTFKLCSAKYNYAENLVINAYILGTTFWASVLLACLTFFIDSPFVLMPLLTLSTVLIIIYLYKKMFELSWIHAFGITVLTQFIVYVILMVIQFSYILIGAFT